MAAHGSGEGVGRVGFELSGAFQTVCVIFKTSEPSPVHLFFYPLYPCKQKPPTCPGHATTGFCSRLWWIECEAVPIPLSPDSGLQISRSEWCYHQWWCSPPTAVALSCSSITFLSFSTRAQNRLIAVNFYIFLKFD